MEVNLSSQQSVILYVLPTLAVLTICATPPVALGSLVRLSHAGQELRNATKRRFSLLSLVINYLSIVFLLSNYMLSSLYLYGIYGAILATANLIADRVAKMRVWGVLLVWHALNLLTLIGGTLGPIVPYSINARGIIGECLSISSRGGFGNSCPEGALAVSWCNNAWISIQLIVAFIYVLLHVAGFFFVCARVVHHFGGGSDGDFGSASFRQSASPPLLQPRRSLDSLGSDVQHPQPTSPQPF